GRRRRLGSLLLVLCLAATVGLAWGDTGPAPAAQAAPVSTQATPMSTQATPVSTQATPVTKIQPAEPAGSAWDQPALVDPTTIVVNARENNLVLDQSKDYILRLTPGVDSMQVGLTV